MNNFGAKTEELARAMKRDWDARAREDARWYINTLRHGQSDDEFDRTGEVEVERLVRADLALVHQYAAPRTVG